MNEMKEAVGNWREAKQFSPADENDFLRWLDKADTEEKLFSRLTFWFTFRGLPADQNQRYHLVQERARELRLWNGLEPDRPGGHPAAGCPGAGDRKACRGAGVVGPGAV